jgi:hypothetical protein
MSTNSSALSVGTVLLHPDDHAIGTF